CPQGIDIPGELTRVHERMQVLREAGQHPGPSAALPGRIVEGRHRILVHTTEVPSRLGSRGRGTARFLIQNTGEERWLAAQHAQDPPAAVGIGIAFDNRLRTVIPLRNTVCPGEISTLAFELEAPREPGSYTVRFCLMPLHAEDAKDGTVFHSGP